MPGLILNLRAREELWVNGVVIKNRDRNTQLVIMTPDAKILRLRNAIRPEEANTPIKRLCLAAQRLVTGEDESEDARTRLIQEAAKLWDRLSRDARFKPLDDATIHLERSAFYEALRELRSLLPLEARLLAESRG